VEQELKPTKGKGSITLENRELFSFEEFRAAILGNDRNFKVDNLFQACRDKFITESERDILHLLHTRGLEEGKDHLEQIADIDTLTGFPKLDSLNKRLLVLITELNHPGGARDSSFDGIVVATIDMKGLKTLNNEYSLIVGNNALRTFAERLKEVIKRRGDQIYRFGGDEFVIVMPIEHMKDGFDFSSSSERIRTAIEDNLSINVKIKGRKDEKNYKQYPLGVYMGYSVSKKGDKKTADELLEESAIEMKKDKDRQKGL
jgi:diguanylate cyclase (GGDEF)-like protein